MKDKAASTDHPALPGIRTILIVDDERPARSELKRMLKDLGMTGAVHEAASVRQALESAKDSHPDLILLDIQMPGGSGFDLLRQLSPNRPPVIFTTAHEQFATRAFEEEAVDYLLKPFGRPRLAKALSRLSSSAPDNDLLSQGDMVLLKIDGECQLLPVEKIELIEATADGTMVHWDENSGIVNRTLLHLEERLDPALFFRCSREAIINLRFIQAVAPDEKGILSARLTNRRDVTFSRRQSALFRKHHRA